MDPVEDRAAAVVGVAARHGDERLHEAQAGADDAQQGVRVLSDGDLGPALWEKVHTVNIGSGPMDRDKLI